MHLLDATAPFTPVVFETFYVGWTNLLGFVAERSQPGLAKHERRRAKRAAFGIGARKDGLASQCGQHRGKKFGLDQTAIDDDVVFRADEIERQIGHQCHIEQCYRRPIFS